MVTCRCYSAKKGIEVTKFIFRDAKVPRTRLSCRLQALTGETPAAANDSSQQTAEDHFRVTVYYTEGNQGLRSITRKFCAHWEKLYSTVLQATTTSKLYQIFMAWNSEMPSSEKSIFENYDCGGPIPAIKRSCDGKDYASKWSP